MTTEAVSTSPLNATDPAALRPLTVGEKGLWHENLLGPVDSSYCLPMAFELVGPRAANILTDVLATLVDRHPILSARVSADGEQWIRGSSPIGPVVDGSSLDIEPLAFVRQQAGKPFDLEVDRPARLGVITFAEDRAVVWLVLHHIVTDLQTAVILVEEALVLLRGKPLPDPPPVDGLLTTEREYFESSAADVDRAYWSALLERCSPRPSSPHRQPRPDSVSQQVPRLGSAGRKLGPPDFETLKRSARRRRRPLGALIQAAYCLALHRVTGESDVVIGVTGNARTGATARVCGYGVNTVPFPSRLPADDQHDHDAELMEQAKLLARHRRHPAACIAALRQPSERRHRLFDDLLVVAVGGRGVVPVDWFVADGLKPVTVGHYQLKPMPIPRQAIQVRTILRVILEKQTLTLDLEYDRARLGPGEAECLCDAVVDEVLRMALPETATASAQTQLPAPTLISIKGE